jgi:pimeloyl-ACP methyl ester carboxylesterase
VAFDLRGHGASDKPDCDYSFNEFADDLADLIKGLDLSNITLVGWSMGVSVSLSYFKRYRGKSIKNVVLVAGPIKLVRASNFPYGIPLKDVKGYLQRKISNRAHEEHAFVTKSFYHPEQSNVNWLVQIAMQTPLDVCIKCVREQMKMDYRSTLKKIRQPALVVFGKYERFYPQSLGEWTASHLPNGRLKIFENSAHVPFQEEVDLFNKTVSNFVLRN